MRTSFIKPSTSSTNALASAHQEPPLHVNSRDIYISAALSHVIGALCLVIHVGELEKLVGNSQDPFKLAMSSASYALYSQKQLGVFFFSWK